MSAYLCDEATTHAILTVHLVVLAAENPNSEASIVVDALIERGVLGAVNALNAGRSTPGADHLWGQLSDIGRDLIATNRRSLEERYELQQVENMWGADGSSAYVFKPLAVDDLIAAAFRTLGAIKSWRYQSCEHRGHKAEPGWIFVEELRERIFEVFELPDGVGWDITDGERGPLLARTVFSLCVHDNEVGLALDAALKRWNAGTLSTKVA